MTMTDPLWNQICTYTKPENGTPRETCRIFMKQIGWRKDHSDKTGQDVFLNSVDDLSIKIQMLKKTPFVHATGD